MSPKEAFFERVVKLREDDFTKAFIVPLFQRMGYSFVDFHGGPYERGKDVIATKTGAFGELELTVVQVKKITAKTGAQKSQKFGEYVHQLRQCRQHKIPCLDGISRFPTKVILLTPNTISVRNLEEQLDSVDCTGVTIVEQSRLGELYDKHWPEVYDSDERPLTGAMALMSTDTRNEELYNLLKVESNQSYSSYYSDLSFFVGRLDSHRLFSSNLELSLRAAGPYSSEQWSSVLRLESLLRDCLGIGAIVGPLESVTAAFEKWRTNYNSSTNRQLMRELSSLKAEEPGELLNLETIYRELREAVSAQIGKLKSQFVESEELSSLMYVNDQLASSGPGSWANIDLDRSVKGSLTKKMRGLIDVYDAKVLSRDKRKLAVANLDLRCVKEPMYVAELQLKPAEDLYNTRIRAVASAVAQLDGGLSDFEIKKILNETNDLMRDVDRLLSFEEENIVTPVLKKVASFNGKVNLSAHRIFDSGMNVAVYGEAGAGKSTTLYFYAEKFYKNKLHDEQVLFMPLNRIVRKLTKLSVEERLAIVNPAYTLESLLNAFLMYKDLIPDEQSRNNLIKFLSSQRKVLLIVDALDEAAESAEWIIPALSRFAAEVPSAQVLTSSRDCVKLIRNVEFLGITLLPFTEEQLKRFMFGWMRDGVLAKNLWESIQGTQLVQVAKNPLLATIICTLHENGIKVPRNEPDVYSRKIEFLCGLYDQHKGIIRTKCDKPFLEECCRKIAFKMHSKGQREATREELLQYLRASKEGRVDAKLFSDAVEDLIFCCNVLIKSPDDETYTFGHLRIQEALAAEELARNRSIDIVHLMDKTWWLGALYLYSFKNSIENLFDDIYARHGNFKRYAPCLRSMITAQPEGVRPHLLKLLARHRSIDDFDGFDEFGFFDSGTAWSGERGRY